ncbi:metalloregulator ArsR/SmtB family transcription factor [Pedobacter sp. SYP-B3415]|uniref:ArsR/SmtB family transcription factor n=1 Tax=Pedobacter sp. SYP-B3415 TaxID=2496641 RepID=UPI001F10987E|nr:metalloregulator ArsR/SmtB family transcription factor [Pedobacter sp. SYP-B3415]
MQQIRRDVFQAIADPTRRAIIGMLATQTMNLNHVAAAFDISRPAISKHIKILSECGLVTISRKGRERICRADLGQLHDVAEWVNQYQKMWNTKLDALGSFLEQEQSGHNNL